MKSKTSTKQQAVQTPTVSPLANSAYSGIATAANAMVDANPANFMTPINASQQAGFSAASRLAPNAAIGEGMDATRGLLNFDTTNPAAYFNPYDDSVVQTSVNDLDRARRIALVGNSASSTAGGSGAWMGDRAGVADAETNRGFLDTVASLTANLRKAGYDTARSAMLGDANFRLGAADRLFNMGTGADANARANIGTQLDAGAQQRAAEAENNPEVARLKQLAAIQALLAPYMGQTTNSSGSTTSSPGLLQSVASLAGGVGGLFTGIGALSKS